MKVITRIEWNENETARKMSFFSLEKNTMHFFVICDGIFILCVCRFELI